MKLLPREIVAELDTFVVGQAQAKRSVATALRNRWRRLHVEKGLRTEITPKNILMIGPTGVGKTEIARRLAKLVGAPFIKVEATKFTEVGYVGRDVDSIIRDLMMVSMKVAKEEARRLIAQEVEDEVENYILDRLLHRNSSKEADDDTPQNVEVDDSSVDSKARQLLRKQLREGTLDDKHIVVEIRTPRVMMEVMSPPGMEEIADHLRHMFSQSHQARRTQKKKILIKDARGILTDQITEDMLDEEAIRVKAIEDAEEKGIVFLDEIDKIAKGDLKSADVSRAGVQRDLLPLVEGTSVQTKFGTVRTNHILFIASGAFHLSKPSDLIPELQGRLPIRVELQSLTPQDFKRILTQTKASLLRQYTALFATENLTVKFTDEAVDAIAEYAWQVNESVENIGARRLHTVMERLLEEISFTADMLARTEGAIEINKVYVDEHLSSLVKDANLNHYIL